MKRWLVCLPVLALLLGGCGTEQPAQTTQTVPTEPTQQTQPTDPGLYDPTSQLEKQTAGAVRAYPLEGECIGLDTMGQQLVIFTREGEDTRLTRLRGENAIREATVVLPGTVCPEASNVWLRDHLAAYYLAGENCLVLLDESFQQIDRIPLQGQPTGAMAMDTAMTTLYYGTGEELRALDTDTGVCRLVRQHTCREQGVEQCILEDTLLACRVVQEDGRVSMEFISAQNGQLQQQDDTLRQLQTWQEDWFAVHTDGSVTELLYSVQGQEPRLWLPQETDPTFYQALSMGAMVVASQVDNGCRLTAYDMATGTRSAAVVLPANEVAYILADPAGDSIWFLARNTVAQANTLCRWDPAATPLDYPTNYTTRRYTAQDPDVEGLAHCRAQADALEEEFGITVYLEAPEKLPEDYTFTWEYQVAAIQQGLKDMETVLRKFPEGFFKTAARVFDSRQFPVLLVRQVCHADGAPVEDVTGVQYWIKGSAYMAVAVGEDTQGTFLHQLSHMLETFIFSKTSRLDTWDTLNPQGFAYLENYSDYLQHLDSPYLQGEERAFIDAFSMTYPREDIATVLEYALQDGNEEYFQSPILQQKLKKLCEAIRRAYKWRKDPREFPWEQYLQESLAYIEE